MDQESFVKVLQDVILPNVVSGNLQSLRSPPGRRPSIDRVQRSQWYVAQSDVDREKVDDVLRFGVEIGFFQMLCVLDGVTTVEDAPDKGDLVLTWRSPDGQREVVLSGPGSSDFLHDLFRTESK
jgi:hypothetical protein